MENETTIGSYDDAFLCRVWTEEGMVKMQFKKWDRAALCKYKNWASGFNSDARGDFDPPLRVVSRQMPEILHTTVFLPGEHKASDNIIASCGYGLSKYDSADAFYSDVVKSLRMFEGYLRPNYV